MKAAKKKEWYYRQKDLGLCVECSSLAEEGFIFCTKHRKKSNAGRKLRVKSAKANGRCRDCGKKKENPAKCCCNECLDKQTVRAKEFRYERIKAGLCATCGKKNNTEYESCSECLELGRIKRSELRAWQRENGRCTNCGGISDGGYSLCATCAEVENIAKKIQRSL